MTMLPHLVLFIDILGFRDECIAAADDPTAGPALVERFTATVGPALRTLQQTMGDAGCDFRIFTDNILVAIPIGPGTDDEDAVGLAVTAFAQFQLDLAVNGYFVRGGVDLGDFVTNDVLVFGAPLVRAYNLESKIADVPRIVFHQDLEPMIQRQLEYYGEPWSSPHNGYLLRDADGYVFLNYLYAPIGMGADESRHEVLAAHRDAVANKLVSLRKKPKERNKLRWVGEYHNFVVRTWAYKAEDRLLIPQDLIGAAPELLVKEQGTFWTRERAEDRVAHALEAVQSRTAQERSTGSRGRRARASTPTASTTRGTRSAEKEGSARQGAGGERKTATRAVGAPERNAAKRAADGDRKMATEAAGTAERKPAKKAAGAVERKPAKKAEGTAERSLRRRPLRGA